MFRKSLNRPSVNCKMVETIESSEMAALQMMEGDLDNVRAAWRRSLAETDASNAARFVEALWYLYEVRGWHQAGADLLGEGAAALPEDSADEATTKAWALAAATHSLRARLWSSPATLLMVITGTRWAGAPGAAWALAANSAVAAKG